MIVGAPGAVRTTIFHESNAHHQHTSFSAPGCITNTAHTVMLLTAANVAVHAAVATLTLHTVPAAACIGAVAALGLAVYGLLTHGAPPSACAPWCGRTLRTAWFVAAFLLPAPPCAALPTDAALALMLMGLSNNHMDTVGVDCVTGAVVPLAFLVSTLAQPTRSPVTVLGHEQLVYRASGVITALLPCVATVVAVAGCTRHTKAAFAAQRCPERHECTCMQTN